MRIGFQKNLRIVLLIQKNSRFGLNKNLASNIHKRQQSQQQVVEWQHARKDESAYQESYIES